MSQIDGGSEVSSQHDQLPESIQEEIRLQSRREKLDQLLDSSEFDEIGNQPDIRIVERADDLPGQDCSTYALGRHPNQYTELLRIIEEYDEVDEPKDGDVVVYFNDGNMKHVGRVVEGNKVISKWGIAHAFEHPKELVPTYYYTKPEDIKTFRKPQID